jgi:pyrroloquinoline-quinone synthase
MTLIERLDEARRRCHVLEHPFYTRWEKGELTRDELADYAGQYHHVVVALAETAAAAADLTGPEHADEETAHVQLWDDFAVALGSQEPKEPLPETAHCVEAWMAAETPLEAVAVLYAIEAGQPEISKTKLDGLVTHYGFEPDSAATAYFSLHAERDHEHAAASRAILEEATADPEPLVKRAEAALAGNWVLLDGVSR